MTTRTVELAALAAWTTIPGLEDVSGIGRYATTVTAPADWRDGAGAWLDLGVTFDTVRVTLNGERLPAVSPLVTRIDLGARLRPGRELVGRRGDHDVVQPAPHDPSVRVREVEPSGLRPDRAGDRAALSGSDDLRRQPQLSHSPVGGMAMKQVGHTLAGASASRCLRARDSEAAYREVSAALPPSSGMSAPAQR